LSKVYDSGSSLNKSLLEGIKLLADNVASTLGPRGRNVILHSKSGEPIITKDGVTVAAFVDLDDPIQNAGAQIMRQAAAKTNSDAGDGTTTATVLAMAILEQSQRYLIAGASPVELKRGMDKAAIAIVNNLREASSPISDVEDIRHIATISANGDKSIGTLIATAIDQVGKDGAVTIEESRSLETSLDLIEGFRFDSGYVASSFVNNNRNGTCTYEEPLILVCDEAIDGVTQILPLLETASRESRPLVVVAAEVEGQALAALVMNSVRGTMKVAAVKAPRYGEERREILKDLCESIGATFITKEAGITLKDVKLTHLGQAKKIEIGKALTTIIGGAGDYEKVDERIEKLKAELGQTENVHETERLQERITRLASGVAIIRVGAATEIELVEKQHRIEDALEAVKSAQQEGIVPGGGAALVRAVQNLEVNTDNEEQNLGVEIIRKAAYAPLRQMAANAGHSPDIVQATVEAAKGVEGYNFATGEVVDLIAAGVVDPVKVTRSALQNAVSVASTLITTNYAIIEQ